MNRPATLRSFVDIREGGAIVAFERHHPLAPRGSNGTKWDNLCAKREQANGRLGGTVTVGP